MYATQGALRDGLRAWRIAPPRHSRATYHPSAPGVSHLRARRRFRARERLRLKLRYAVNVTADSRRVRRAPEIVIPALPSEGLLANLLHVLEVAHRARGDAAIRVDWVLAGDEPGFRYGLPGDDVWRRLFDGLDRPLGPAPLLADQPLDFALWGTGRDRLRGRGLQRHRDAYAATAARTIRIADADVAARVDAIASRLDGRLAVGVHRRLPTARMANLQVDGALPEPQQLIAAVERVVGREGAPDWMVYLATDDADVIGAFERAFGPRLALQAGVQRTTADDVEVHYGRPSFANAEAVLVDTAVLSRCDVLVHASSSISTIAGLMNPRLELVRVLATAAPGPP